jgi:hypothetical protein
MCRVDELTNRLECIHRVIVKQEVGARRNLHDLHGTRAEPQQIRQRLVGVTVEKKPRGYEKNDVTEGNALIHLTIIRLHLAIYFLPFRGESD